MEPLQGVVHDAVVEGVREGFGSASAAILLFSSSCFSGLLPLKLDAEGTPELPVLADVRALRVHELRGAGLPDNGPLVHFAGFPPASGSSHLQGVCETLGHRSYDIFHRRGFSLRRFRDGSFAFTRETESRGFIARLVNHGSYVVQSFR